MELNRNIEAHTIHEFEKNESMIEDIKNGKEDLLIDLDNTISNQIARQATYIREKVEELGIEIEDPGDNTIIKNPKVKEIRKTYYEQPDQFLEQSLIHGVKQGLDVLKKAGYKLHVCSSRQEGLHEITHEWLEKVGIEEMFETINLGDPSLGEQFKVDTAKEKNALCIIDDLANVADKIADEDINAIRIKRSWMKKVVQNEDVTELKSFYRAALYLAKQKVYATENIS